ncbi:MAG: MlaE family ABC transporter permease, partial [Pseudonocardiaceae bacterium]
SVVGLQGFRALDSLGTEALTGFVTAYFTTRDIAPLVASQAVICTLGAGYTAELGAMRISEEIDALEAMSVPSVPFLITTRVLAGFVAIIPLYTIGLIMSYAAARLNVTVVSGLPGGTYDHYFELFLPAGDVLWSYVKVLAFTFVIILICCHYGYRASGGPAGVGIAVGRAVRASIVTVAAADFFLTLAIFGTASTVRVAG